MSAALHETRRRRRAGAVAVHGRVDAVAAEPRGMVPRHGRPVEHAEVRVRVGDRHERTVVSVVGDALVRRPDDRRPDDAASGAGDGERLADDTREPGDAPGIVVRAGADDDHRREGRAEGPESARDVGGVTAEHGFRAHAPPAQEAVEEEVRADRERVAVAEHRPVARGGQRGGGGERAGERAGKHDEAARARHEFVYGRRASAPACHRTRDSNMSTGFVGILSFELHFPESHSLKEKRMHLRSVKQQLANRTGCSIAEVDHHDAWQRAQLTLACVARATSPPSSAPSALAYSRTWYSYSKVEDTIPQWSLI